MKRQRFTFFFAALVLGASWWVFSGSVHVPQASAVESGITVRAITVTGSDQVPGQEGFFYGGSGTSVTFSVTVTNNGASDITETLQNQFVFDRYSADDASAPWRYTNSLDRPVYIPLVGIKKGERKTISLVNNELLSSGTYYYIKFRVDETHLIHGVSEPNIESPAARIKIIDKQPSSQSSVSATPSASAIAMGSNPVGAKSCTPQGITVREIPPYPLNNGPVSVYWKTWGTGEFARAFRRCEMARNECALTQTGKGPFPLCEGKQVIPLQNGESHFAWTSNFSVISPSLAAAAGIHVQSGPNPGTGDKLPEPSPITRPKYHEL